MKIALMHFTNEVTAFTAMVLLTTHMLIVREPGKTCKEYAEDTLKIPRWNIVFLALNFTSQLIMLRTC